MSRRMRAWVLGLWAAWGPGLPPLNGPNWNASPQAEAACPKAMKRTRHCGSSAV